jgi:hypothetical protein
MKRVRRRSRKTGPSGRNDPALRAYLAKLERYRAGRDPLALLRTGPARIMRAVRGLRKAQLRRRPARDKWSILEILGHLHDTEVVYGYRWRMMAAEPGAVIQGYDQARWALDLRHRDADAARLIGQIRSMRQGSLDLLSRVPRRQWKSRYGRHTERGRETLERSVRQIAGHDGNHIAQIQAIRKKYGW